PNPENGRARPAAAAHALRVPSLRHESHAAMIQGVPQAQITRALAIVIQIIGSIVVVGGVVGGFILEGGHIFALWHPTEVLIIVGAALGAFMTSNPPKICKAAFVGAIGFVKGPRYKREDYVALLKLLYEILVKVRKEGLMAIEGDLEAPAGGALFKNYP